MEDIQYFTKYKITLDDLANCAQAAGYDCGIVKDPYRLVVNFTYTYDSKKWQDYWWWSPSTSLEVDSELLGDFEYEVIKSVNPLSVFYGGFRVYNTPHLIIFLRVILRRFEGYICPAVSETLYNINTLHEMLQLYPDMPKDTSVDINI